MEGWRQGGTIESCHRRRSAEHPTRPTSASPNPRTPKRRPATTGRYAELKRREDEASRIADARARRAKKQKNLDVQRDVVAQLREQEKITINRELEHFEGGDAPMNEEEKKLNAARLKELVAMEVRRSARTGGNRSRMLPPSRSIPISTRACP